MVKKGNLRGGETQSGKYWSGDGADCVEPGVRSRSLVDAAVFDNHLLQNDAGRAPSKSVC